MADPNPKPARPRGISVVAWACLLAVGVGGVATVGTESGGEVTGNVIAVLDTWLRAGWAPALFLVASYGFGRVFTRAIGASRERHAIRLTLGLAVSLSVVHGLGVLGWLSPATSIGLIAVGLFLTLGPALHGVSLRSSPRVSAWSLLLIVPLSIGVVASASPPGWLWGSEFGGYDALSYHLQLPQEWLREGRVWPSEHNVYSFLPSYLESVSVLLAHLTLAPIDSVDGHGLTAGSGWRAMMPQMLHWQISLCAAWAVGRLAAALVMRALRPGDAQQASNADEAQGSAQPSADDAAVRTARVAAWVSGLLVLATPWVLVVGTLAYNEMAVVLLGAGALLVAVDPKIGPVWRGGLSALLVGVACGCKPTAILFVAPPVGLALLTLVPVKRLAPAVGVGVVVGALSLSPWLVRNEVATGNPVFPAAAGVFGDGHYDSDQLARYKGAHEYHGSAIDRLRLLVWTDPAAGKGSPSVERFRGLSNPQWFVLGPFGVIAIGVLLARRQTHRTGALLAAGFLFQLGAWLVFTHLQSRFLLPCVLMLCPAVGVALAMCIQNAKAGRAVAVLVVLAQSGASVVVFITQHAGQPNLRLSGGVSLVVGRPFDATIASALPSAYINTQLPPDSVVYLLGDATPFYFEHRVIYNTTYDTWPLGDAIRTSPQTPSAWTRALRDRGITHVLVAPTELKRLTESGWIDPAITPERLVDWLGTLRNPVAAWPIGGDKPTRVLYRLDAPTTPGPTPAATTPDSPEEPSP